MWPSTSRLTRPGSQFGIWLATAVISPNVNDPRPRRRRRSRRVARRSLRLFRRRPLDGGAPLLRLRRSKRLILALYGVPDRDEWGLRRGVDPARFLLGD